jgi:hypothetical protein
MELKHTYDMVNKHCEQIKDKLKGLLYLIKIDKPRISTSVYTPVN